MHHSKPLHHFSTLFWLHLLFFMHFMIYFDLKWPWIEKHCKWTLKWLKMAWYHNFTHIARAKNWEGYRKNWMHFVYKLDNLFQSIRVSDENSPITKGFQFYNHILTQDFSAFNMHHSKPHHLFSTLFWLHLLFFMHFMIYFELKWPWIEKHCKWTLK